MKRRAKWTTDDPFGLTFQERRIVELLRAGRRTRDICTILNLTTTRSLYTYCYRIFRKTGTHHRLELLAKVPPWSPDVTLEQELEGIVSKGES